MAAVWSYFGGLPAVTPSDDVALFLQFSDVRSVPTEIRQTNVTYWRALFSPSAYLNGEDINKKTFHNEIVPPHWFLVMSFNRPAKYRQLIPKCLGSANLNCAILEANSRFAIVTISGDVTKATVEISAIP
jgi:hypothetical protein